MKAMRKMHVIAFMLCMAGANARAEPIDLIGTRIDLPFDYTLLQTENGRSAGSGTVATQRKLLEVRDGDGKVHKIAVAVVYIAPERVSNHAMEEAIDKSAIEAAAKPGVREAADFRIDGFPFHFIDGTFEDRSYSQRMGINGVVNGAVYRLAVLASDRSPLTRELAERLKAVHLDYAALLKLKPDFEEEARMAVLDDTLDTPLNRLRLGKGTQARLTFSYLQSDADGVAVFRTRSFGLFKAGFWTLQSLGLNISCGRADAIEAADRGDFLQMNSERNDEDKRERYTDVSAPQATTMLGLPARMASAHGGKVAPLRRTLVRRWQVEHDGSVFRIGIERLNGSPVEQSLVEQLQDAKPMCQLGLQFGARPAT